VFFILLVCKKEKKGKMVATAHTGSGNHEKTPGQL
jgi:hypothetical protein